MFTGQTSYLSILCGKVLTECGGQRITMADLQKTRELLNTGENLMLFLFLYCIPVSLDVDCQKYYQMDFKDMKKWRKELVLRENIS